MLASTASQSYWLHPREPFSATAVVAVALARSAFLPVSLAAAAAFVKLAVVAAATSDVVAAAVADTGVGASQCVAVAVAPEPAEPAVVFAVAANSQRPTEEEHLRERPSVAVVVAAAGVVEG